MTRRPIMPDDIRKVAMAFSRSLLEDIGRPNLEKAAEWSKANSPCCATHDYCDANMNMAGAIEEVLEIELHVDSEDDEILTLWNAAWALAIAEGFYLYLAQETAR